MALPFFLHVSFYLFSLVFLTCWAETVNLRRDYALSSGPEKVEDLRFLPPRASTAHSNNDDALEVLNVVLVASVDGKFHALNRTSGQILWSMPSTPFTPPPSDVRDSSQSRPYFLQPLVSTQHPEYDPELDDTYPQETYIIEPQSGDIYVTSSSSEPLQRLPFSMSQLVDMSPFSFGDSDRRVFVGRKKTSLLIIELETGRVKAALDSECPWDPFEDFVEQETDDVDLDELDGTKPAREYPTDIFIGRTDYHISIHTRPLSPSARRPPVQNLSFSTYGPNNQDLEQQASYKRAVDDVYVETLPNGEIISFKTRASDVPLGSHIPDNTFVWGQRFSNPIVAVFDVVKSARRDAPFVLLQPRPRLDDIYPSSDLSAAARQHRFNPEIAYVGLVRETGSLYALSPDHFPLVVFGGPDTEPGLGIDPPPGVMDPHETSSQTDMRSLCRSGSSDRRCSTGVRQLRADSRSRLARLLDGVPQVLPPPSTNTNQLYADAEAEDATLRVGGNRSILHSWPWMIAGQQPHQIGEAPLADHPVALAVLTSIFAGLMLWVVGRKALGSSRRDAGTPAAVTAAVPDSDAIVVSTTIQEPIPVIVDVPLIADLDTSDKSHLDVPASPPPVAQTPTQAEPTPQLQPRALPEIVTVDSPPVQESSDPSEEAGDDESEKEGDAAAVPGKRKTARRRRGKKKRGGQKDAAADEGDVDEPEKWEVVDAGGDSAGQNVVAAGSSNILIVPPTPTPTTPSLIVSDTILGFGSHGTVVYQGSLQGRAVAVKRLLQDFVTLASREVTLLQDADDHPNVIRYYYQESQANFLYIALELCPASLADIIERPDQFREIAIAFNPKRALRQVTSGLRHLHALKIVHRDIKPQNILISSAKKGESSGHRMLISDFGLCRKLESDQTSFLPTANGMMGVGTVGWRAPEILRGEVKLDETTGDDHSQSSRDSVGTATGSVNSGMGRPATRLTKSVDIFALGCLYYYCLSNGGHPFGDRFEREVNILRNSRSLDALEGFGEEGSEAVDLISSMLAPEASDRPDTTQCLMHPYFWDPGRRLGFLQDASDRFEIMCRDPRDPNLVALETGAVNVVGQDWAARLDKIFVENLGKFRKYDGKSVQDLLRALRNKKHHYQDLPENVKRHVGSMPEGYLLYFTRRYPRLFLHVHSVVSDSSLRQESMFRSYFELTD